MGGKVILQNLSWSSWAVFPQKINSRMQLHKLKSSASDIDESSIPSWKQILEEQIVRRTGEFAVVKQVLTIIFTYYHIFIEF